MQYNNKRNIKRSYKYSLPKQKLYRGLRDFLLCLTTEIRKKYDLIDNDCQNKINFSIDGGMNEKRRIY